MNPTTVYMCSVCEREHDDYYEAEECCQPEVWTLYRCEICGETHEDESDAIECCLTEDEADAINTGGHRWYPDNQNTASYIEKFIRVNHYVN